MGLSNPSNGLFPNKSNFSYHDIQIHWGSSEDNNHNNTDENNNNVKKSKCNNTRTSIPDDASDNITSNSIESSVINAIIQQEGWHDIESFYDDIRNDRFYLFEHYLRHNSEFVTETAFDPSSLDDDFTFYDKKVQQEYVLREKIGKVLRSKDLSGIHIYNEEMLENTYLATNNTYQKKSKSLRHYLYSVLPKPTFSKSIKNNVSLRSIKDSISSSPTTHNIDETSYRNLVIDENNLIVTRHKTGETLLLESSIDVTSNHTRNTWKQFIRDFLSKDNHYYIQRRMTVRHIQMLSVGPCLSVGFFLTSGEAFSIAGPFGTLLGFILTGSVILATLLSFTELSALIPVSSGFSGLASRFVEDAFGFAIGWTYVFSCIISFPAEAASSTFYLTSFSNVNLTRGTIAGFVTLFIIYPILCNLLRVNLMGEVIFFFGSIKILISVIMMFVMIILNSGHGDTSHSRVGFRFWDSSKSVGDMTYGLFRPTFDLMDAGTGSMNGIGGSTGRFLALLSVVLTSTFAYSGVEMTFLASGEVKNPRKTIPSSIKRTFSIILTIFILSILTVGINIYSGDPRLLSYDTSSRSERSKAADLGIGTQWQIDDSCKVRTKIPGSSVEYSSPWVLALQSYGLCTFSAAFNAILIVFTSSASIASLYNSSRALYSMSIQRKAPYIFQICSKNGVPYVSVITAGLFSLIAYLVVNEGSQSNFDILVNMSSASTSIIWFGLNASFLRFYYALRRRSDFLSRDDKSYPFKSPFQPFLAIYGLVGCSIFVIFMGFSNFITGFWNVRSFFSAYGGLMIFTCCYIGYKIVGTSKIQRLDRLDMDTGRREMDRMIWSEHRQYNIPLWKRVLEFWS